MKIREGNELKKALKKKNDDDGNGEEEGRDVDMVWYLVCNSFYRIVQS